MDLVQVIHANGRNPVHAQLLGGFDTGMAGQDCALRIDEHRSDELEFLDTRCELLDLLRAVGAGVVLAPSAPIDPCHGQRLQEMRECWIGGRG